MREVLDPDMAEAMAFEAARDAAMPPPRDLDEERARGRAGAAFWNEGLPEMAAVEDHVAPGPGGPVPVRVFRPVAERPLPVLLYVYGGGWVVGSVVQNEPLIRTLAARTGWAIAAPTYRLAPEHPFPAGLEDVIAAGQWLQNDGAAHGLDAGRMAISGTSAGGNLALAAAVSGKLERLAGLVLFYGVFGADLETASYRRFADGRFGLSRERMAYFIEQYDPTGQYRADPLLQPLLADVAGLPPTWLLAAGLDVLCSDTLALHGRLTEAGVRTTLHFEPGVVHGFINRGRMVKAARRSLDGAAQFLRSLTSETL